MTEGLDYLLPYRGSFWCWRDQGEVLEWNGGPTIAFRGELLAVLKRLAPQGLPPFGSLILLLAATRDNWHELTAEPRILSDMLGSLPESGPYSVQARGTLGAALGELDRVRLTDAELRTPLEAKAALCELVFQGQEYRTSRKTAQAVVDLIEHGLGEEDLNRLRDPWTRGQNELRDELRVLYLGLVRNFDADALKMRLQTGVDQVPEPAEVDIPLSERVRALLGQLRNDEELSGLAALAHDLMAAVTLPRSLTDREELPTGGFSDIANRGSLDRLLLSELAHDDLTLAVRVAVNEALYLRRESPPRNPPSQRALLLETGIRSWGVPRLFATAVALAMAATSERNADLRVFRAQGSRIQPVDLTTRTGLVEHLAVLESDLHPGEALDAFRKEVADYEDAAEPVMIMSEDVLADREFQATLRQSGIEPLMLATVNRSGRFQLAERTLHGERRIREALLNMDTLFAEPKRVVPTLMNREGLEGLPAILSVEPFPLRLSHNIDPSRAWRMKGHGVLYLTRDRRLTLWTHRSQGAIQLSDTIPSNYMLRGVHCSTDGTARAIVADGHRHQLWLLHIDLKKRCCDTRLIEISQPANHVFWHNGMLFVLSQSQRQIDIVEDLTGRLIETTTVPPRIRWKHDRFFHREPYLLWYAASHDGRKLAFEPVTHRVPLGKVKLIAMFEREGIEGPIAVTEYGDLYLTATDKLRKVRHGLTGPLQVAAIAHDGSRIALQERSSTQCTILDVDNLTTFSRHGDPRQFVDPILHIVRPVNLRNRFTHIRVDDRGVLVLTDRKGVRHGIEYLPGLDQIRLKEIPAVPAGGQTFKPVKTARNVGYRLTAATFDDGSRVFLDSRGLLHLKSADRKMPETTIVLTEGELSGWCSDGRMWGTPYHLGDHTGAHKQWIYETAIRAFGKRLS